MVFEATAARQDDGWYPAGSAFILDRVTSPCPCCGHLVFAEPPGSYDICPVCFWEDDAVQIRWPDRSGGANAPSLVDSQRNVVLHGAMEARFAGNVRQPTLNEPVDPAWRPVDPALDDFEPRGAREAEWPSDLSVLYYWRPEFWRRRSGASAS